MPSSFTTNLNLEKPAKGEQEGEWGDTLNANFDIIDTKLAIKDEDNMASDSASHLATQQSIKAYVDSQVATEDTLTELNDTSISSPAAGHLIIYDNTASHWENATLTAGSNISITNGDGAITIASTDTNTQLSQEQVEDYVGGMLDGTETFIDVSYDDTDGNIDFVVPVKDEDNMASDSATHLATQQSIKAYVDGKVGATALDDITTGDAASTLATSAGNITIDAQGDDTDIILKGTDGGADTTFLTIDGSDAGTASFNHDVKLANDAAVLGFGADNDVTLTHVADTGVTLSAGDNATVLQLDSNNSGASSGPKIILNRTSDSPADDDYTGTIIFQGENDNNQQFKTAQLSAQANDVSDGTEDSQLQLATIINGTLTNGVVVTSNGVSMPTQPAWGARGTGSVTMSGTSSYVVAANSVEVVDIGGNYDTSTYQFTAPMDGTYYVAMSFCPTTLPGVTGPAQWLFKNGSVVKELGINYSSDRFETTTGVYILSLDAGDYIEQRMVNYNNTTFVLDRSRGFFGGFLIG